jgi:hypothetical protein
MQALAQYKAKQVLQKYKDNDRLQDRDISL